MKRSEFKKEIEKVMPGYLWTVHISPKVEGYMSATGIISSGFNRLSTLLIERREFAGKPISYEARSAGYGKRSPWLSAAEGRTLKQALRILQDHYEAMACTYRSHANYLQNGRKSNNLSGPLQDNN